MRPSWRVVHQTAIFSLLLAVKMSTMNVSAAPFNSASPIQARVRYQNPILPTDSPDPGVLHEKTDWWMATTGGDNKNGAFPIYSSKDLIHWEAKGSIFAPGNAPKWSDNSYWAPEIHKVGDSFVAYFTARDSSGMLRIGAATSDKIGRAHV